MFQAFRSPNYTLIDDEFDPIELGHRWNWGDIIRLYENKHMDVAANLFRACSYWANDMGDRREFRLQEVLVAAKSYPNCKPYIEWLDKYRTLF